MKRRLAVGAAVIMAASAVLIGVGAAPAAGALTTRCIGVATDVTVPGDLVVPADESCSLVNVRVGGSVRVGRGADLVLDLDSAVDGDLRIAPGGFVDVTDAAIGGSLIARGLFAASIENATIGGDARFNDVEDRFSGPGLVSIQLSEVAGSIRAASGEISVETSRVLGDVRSDGATFVDLVDATVNGRLRIQNTEFGTLVCASEIYGSSLINGNAYGVHLGADRGLGACSEANFWGDDLIVRDNVAPEVGVLLTNNIVAGSLNGDGNSPQPAGEGNRVRGGTTGQFVDLAPIGTTDVVDEATRTPIEVSGTVAGADDAIARRRAEAVTAATASGPADLSDLRTSLDTGP